MRILIAEDDPVSRRVLDAKLQKWGYTTILAEDGREAWEILCREDAPKLAILDWMMPEMDGPEVCSRIRDRVDKDYVYLILLTAKGGKSDVISGLNSGADDYITKPFNSGELEVRLHAARRILDLESRLLDMTEQLRIQATHDGLTGIWNRAATMDVLHNETARAMREDTCLGLVMIDIDKFKNINDTCGHQVGDVVLQEVVRRVNVAVRPYDSFGRYGGEEFIVVLPRCDSTFAAYVGERIRDAVAITPIVVDEKRSLNVSVSVGVASKVVEREEDSSNLLMAADVAMYRAKEAGRNRVEVATEEEIACHMA